MTVNKIKLKSFIVLVFFIIISGLYLMISNSLINDIVSMFILTLGAACAVRFNMTHPYVWYSVFFTLYATGYPLLLYFNASPVYYGYSKELIILHWIALVTFLIVVTPKVVYIKSIEYKVKKFDCVLSKYLYFILSYIMVVFIIFLKIKGYTSKNEMQSSDSIFVYIGMRLILIYILITTIELIKDIYKTNKLNYRIVIITFILLFFLFLYSAERDLVLRYLLILFIIYYIFLYKKRDKGKLILIIVLLFLLIPISKSIKYFGMRGEIYSLRSNFIIEFVNSEFSTQARNVQLLLNSNVYKGYFNGKTFLTLVTRFFGLSHFSSLKWFHETYYSASKTGMGFTLVGEGYVNMGYLGVIIMFIIVGLIVKTSYQNSNKSIYNLVGYLILIPISIYVIRADLYNFLSQYIKQVLLIIFLLRFTDKLLIKRSTVEYYGYPTRI